jgi:hypothetical protein
MEKGTKYSLSFLNNKTDKLTAEFLKNVQLGRSVESKKDFTGENAGGLRCRLY